MPDLTREKTIKKKNKNAMYVLANYVELDLP